MNETYIAHHGISGQKWGKKNGPPYPLKESQKSFKEKKRTSTSGKINKDEIFDLATGLAYSMASIGTILGALTGNPLIAAGSNYVSSAMVVGATMMIAPDAIASGRNFVKQLQKG